MFSQFSTTGFRSFTFCRLIKYLTVLIRRTDVYAKLVSSMFGCSSTWPDQYHRVLFHSVLKRVKKCKGSQIPTGFENPFDSLIGLNDFKTFHSFWSEDDVSCLNLRGRFDCLSVKLQRMTQVIYYYRSMSCGKKQSIFSVFQCNRKEKWLTLINLTLSHCSIIYVLKNIPIQHTKKVYVKLYHWIKLDFW